MKRFGWIILNFLFIVAGFGISFASFNGLLSSNDFITVILFMAFFLSGLFVIIESVRGVRQEVTESNESHFGDADI